MNKADMVDDEELVELGEMEIRELLGQNMNSQVMTHQLFLVQHLKH